MINPKNMISLMNKVLLTYTSKSMDKILYQIQMKLIATMTEFSIQAQS